MMFGLKGIKGIISVCKFIDNKKYKFEFKNNK